MKKILLFILFLPFVCLANFVADRFVGDASGLTNYAAGVQTNDVTASSYISRNKITNPIARISAYGQAQSAINFGIYSNLLTLVNFRLEYNPTSHFDWFGNKFTVLNEQYTNNGFVSTFTNGVYINGYSLTNNWTIVFTISRQLFAPSAASGGPSQQPSIAPANRCLSFGFENTNTGSAVFLDYGEFKGTGLYQKNQGIWPYQTNVNNLPQVQRLAMLNTLNDYTVQKNVYCLSFINGTNYLWENTLPFFSSGSQALTSSILCTDALQTISFGQSTNYTQTLWNGNPTWHTNGYQVTESVMLFNVAATPQNMNVVYGSYQMAQWPDWFMPYNIFMGDSFIGPTITDQAQYVGSYTNDFPYNYMSFTPSNPNWMNFGQGGATIAGFLTNSTTSQTWPMTPVSLLPQIIMGVPVNIWCDLGRNDQPTNAAGNEIVLSGWLGLAASSYMSLSGNMTWTQILPPQSALSNLVWTSLAGTLQGNTNILAWDATVKSNANITATFDFGQALNTNTLVIGAGISDDGVHGVTNNAGYLSLAKAAHGIQTDFLIPSYVGNFTGAAAGLTNFSAQAGFATTSTNRLVFSSVSSLTNTMGRDAFAAITAGTSVILQDTNGNNIVTIGTIATLDVMVPMRVNMRLSGTGVSATLY